jgi:hypothetical protein
MYIAALVKTIQIELIKVKVYIVSATAVVWSQVIVFSNFLLFICKNLIIKVIKVNSKESRATILGAFIVAKLLVFVGYQMIANQLFPLAHIDEIKHVELVSFSHHSGVNQNTQHIEKKAY